MIFQQVNINMGETNNEFMRICESHPECNGCELKKNDLQIQNSVIRCETGRAKGE